MSPQVEVWCKSSVKKLIDWLVAIMGATAVGRYAYARIIDAAMSRTQTVDHRGLRLVFAVPNALNKYRVDTFSTKEPETLAWIDAIPEGSVLWDIGANVGLYTCYAAKARNCRVFAFEPSAFNLELLARNIFLNGVTARATIVPLPLAEELAVSTLNMTTTEWGGALSSFGQPFGHDGGPMHKVFEFPTIGLSMVDSVELLGVPPPGYIKLDVDGIEHLILKGGMPVLRGAREILVEINDRFTAQAEEAARCLRQAGFVLREKTHADCLNTGMSEYTFNQIWVRSASEILQNEAR